MRDARLKVKIGRPSEEVFAFAINPKNTPKWIKEIVIEKTNEWPVKIHSIYRNQNETGEWSEYTVTEFEEGKVFTLSKKKSDYHVRYTVVPINEASCELEYYEWVDTGNLEEPFTQDVLEELKRVVENDESSIR